MWDEFPISGQQQVAICGLCPVSWRKRTKQRNQKFKLDTNFAIPSAAVARHFLMSAAARTLSLVDLCDLSIAAAQPSIPNGVGTCSNARPAAGSFQRPANLARLPEAAGSGPAYGFQSVRQRRQGHQQSSFEPKSGVTYEDRVRLTSQAAMRFDVELHDDHFSGVDEIDGGWFGGHTRCGRWRTSR